MFNLLRKKRVFKNKFTIKDRLFIYKRTLKNLRHLPTPSGLCWLITTSLTKYYSNAPNVDRENFPEFYRRKPINPENGAWWWPTESYRDWKSPRMEALKECIKECKQEIKRVKNETTRIN